MNFFLSFQENYQEIVSQARTVTASTRATEKEPSSSKDSNKSDNKSDGSGSGSKHSTEQDTEDSSPNTVKKEESVAKGLERRYHLLYLKAIEVQCMLENLLEKRQSPVSLVKYGM